MSTVALFFMLLNFVVGVWCIFAGTDALVGGKTGWAVALLAIGALNLFFGFTALSTTT